MLIAPILLSLASALPLSAGQEPTAERVEAAVAELQSAFKDGDAAARIAALKASVDAVDARVVGLVAAGLKDKERSVALVACDSLGRMRHPDSIKALKSFYAGEKKKLGKDEEGLVAVLASIGRLGDPKGIDVLVDSPFKSTGYPVVQARFLGLANIRSTESVEALFGLLNKVGNLDQDRYMTDIRLALVQLTGEDRGSDPRQWQAWWQENKKGYQIPAEAKELPIEMRLRWNAFWGIEEQPSETGR